MSTLKTFNSKTKKGVRRFRRLEQRSLAAAKAEVRKAEKRASKRKRRAALGNFSPDDFRAWGGAL